MSILGSFNLKIFEGKTHNVEKNIFIFKQISESLPKVTYQTNLMQS